MTHTGWRKPTPELGVAEQLAQAGERLSVPKSKAFVAVKRVGAHIGLKAADMMLLDTLGAFTQPQDWEQGQRPIVWASNAFLMEQTGFSLSALKRHARRLAEAGVIAFKDSPNGKRWGHRDTRGRIIEAYGFDLAPLSARAEEFENLHQELQAERRLCQQLKRQIMICRRMIRARLETAKTGAQKGTWTGFCTLFEKLLAQLPKRKVASEQLERLLAWFQDLHSRVEVAYHQVASEDNLGISPETKTNNRTQMAPKVAKNEPDIQTTKQLNSVTCSLSVLGKPGSLPANTTPKVDQTANALKAKKKSAYLDVPMIVQACPEFATWARNIGSQLISWTDAHSVAGQLRPMIGISEQAWNDAQGQLGPQVATAALALVFDKHCSGEVSSPNGYLRGIVKKAGAGALHLDRSFYGRLNAQAAV